MRFSSCLIDQRLLDTKYAFLRKVLRDEKLMELACLEARNK